MGNGLGAVEVHLGNADERNVGFLWRTAFLTGILQHHVVVLVLGIELLADVAILIHVVQVAGGADVTVAVDSSDPRQVGPTRVIPVFVLLRAIDTEDNLALGGIDAGSPHVQVVVASGQTVLSAVDDLCGVVGSCLPLTHIEVNAREQSLYGTLRDHGRGIADAGTCEVVADKALSLCQVFHNLVIYLSHRVAGWLSVLSLEDYGHAEAVGLCGIGLCVGDDQVEVAECAHEKCLGLQVVPVLLLYTAFALSINIVEDVASPGDGVVGVGPEVRRAVGSVAPLCVVAVASAAGQRDGVLGVACAQFRLQDELAVVPVVTLHSGVEC